MTILAIDIGGSGSRAVASTGSSERRVDGPALVVEGRRARHDTVVEALAQALGVFPGPVTTVVVSAASLVSLGDPQRLIATVTELWRPVRVMVASDSLAALVGAWGTGGGAVVAAGTGVIGLGTDLADVWRRSDGWGHIVGDRGGAAWLGQQGLDAALRQYDGRPGGSAALLDALHAAFGSPLDVPARLREAANPATELAGFAPAVTAAAASGDPVAQRILREAASHLAATGLSVLVDGVPARLALIGGLADTAGGLGALFADVVAGARPDLEVVAGTATPLAGALELARLADRGAAPPDHPPYLVTHLTTALTQGAS